MPCRILLDGTIVELGTDGAQTLADSMTPQSTLCSLEVSEEALIIFHALMLNAKSLASGHDITGMNAITQSAYGFRYI